MQKGMLFHELDAPASGAYIQQVVVNLREPLNVPLFKKAWQELVDLHPILRTSFDWESAALPLQHVCPGLSVPWEEQDWSDLSGSAREQQLARFLLARQAARI